MRCAYTRRSALHRRKYRVKEDFFDSTPSVPDFQRDIVRVEEIFKKPIARGGLDRFQLRGGCTVWRFPRLRRCAPGRLFVSRYRCATVFAFIIAFVLSHWLK